MKQGLVGKAYVSTVKLLFLLSIPTIAVFGGLETCLNILGLVGGCTAAFVLFSMLFR